MFQDFFLALGTLLPIVNPLSAALIYLKLAHGKSATERHDMIMTATVLSVLVLWLFLALGNVLLGFFGITIYAFRVAGGLYLGKVAFEMLAKDPRHPVEEYTSPGKAVAVIPLAIPLLSGPGAMTTVLVMTELYAYLAIALAVLAVGLVSWVTFVNARHIERVLGETGMNVVERVLGLLVLVIAVQFLFNGITGYLGTL